MPVTWPEEIGRPLPDSDSRLAMLPTTVTSRPSRIQTVPRPMTIVQCQRDHGRRSRRAGMLVVTVWPVVASAVVMGSLLIERTGGGYPGPAALRPALGESP